MRSFTTLAVLAAVASAPLLVLAGDYDATVFQGIGCRGEIDDQADGNNQGTGCRQAGEGASIFIESLEGECQLFTYSEPGCNDEDNEGSVSGPISSGICADNDEVGDFSSWEIVCP